MNSFRSLIGKDAWRAKEYGADEIPELWEKVQLFYHRYHSVGNFIVLPNRGTWKGGINGRRGNYKDSVIGNWKIIPEFAGVFLVRMDYFEKFYSIYQAESEMNKEFPCGAARLLFGKQRCAPSERMVYIKTRECWDKDIQEKLEIAGTIKRRE